MPVLWGLIAAASFAFIRRALFHTNTPSAAWVTVGINALIFSPAFFLYAPFPDIDSRTLIEILAMTTLLLLLARLFQYLGFPHVGIGGSDVVVGITSLLAAILALKFLGVSLSLMLVAGILATTLGVIFMVYEKSESTGWSKIYVLPFAALKGASVVAVSPPFIRPR